MYTKVYYLLQIYIPPTHGWNITVVREDRIEV